MRSAREYPTEKIRNVAVLGHGGSGKTSLVDALCFTAGTSQRRGNVEEGHAVTLTAPEEVSHGISIQLTPAFAEWRDHKINLLDTPGYLDFTGEALSAVRVSEGAVVVVDATAGVEVGTEKVWSYCEERGIPRIIFVSKMDKENADFDAVFAEIKSRLASAAIPVEIPIGSGEEFRGIINLISEKAFLYKDGTEKGEYEEAEIPGELEAKFEEWDTELQETLATMNEELLDRYLEGGHIDRDELIQGMRLGMERGEVIPVFCGSAVRTYGVRALLDEMVELFPDPSGGPDEVATRPGVDQEVTVVADDDGPLAALVFKTASEPHVGELSFFRVFSGSVTNGMTVTNANRKSDEKLNHLGIPLGKERLEVSTIHAGDIGVVAKLRDTHTNDTFADSERPVTLGGIRFPAPDISMAIRGASRADEDKLGEVLHKLEEEDPSFHSSFEPELGQTIIRGLGELHLDIQMERMKRKYSVEVETEQPRIAYRETISVSGEGHGRHKKQSGGRGQFGDCHIRIKPLPRGEGYRFVDSIKGGVIPNKFIPSVDKGIQEAAQKGVLAGYPMVDFEAEVYDGSYHSVDSSDIAFQIAGSLAFKAAASRCRPVLLEPIMEVEVVTPDEFVGDIMGDLNQRRGRVLGMESDSGRTTIRAHVPQAELYKYAAALRSMTHGRAHHTRAKHQYEVVPDAVASRVIAAQTAKAAG